jgi:hypothetical protein
MELLRFTAASHRTTARVRLIADQALRLKTVQHPSAVFHRTARERLIATKGLHQGTAKGVV